MPDKRLLSLEEIKQEVKSTLAMVRYELCFGGNWEDAKARIDRCEAQLAILIVKGTEHTEEFDQKQDRPELMILEKTKDNCPKCGGDGRTLKFLARAFSNRCPECNGYGKLGDYHIERLAVIAIDQSLPEYQPDPIWKRFTSKEVEQNMVNKGWRKIDE